MMQKPDGMSTQSFAVYTAVSFVLLVLNTAVGSDAISARQSYSVRDSGGITILENSGPVWSGGQGWRVGTDPDLSIGTVAGDPNYIFEQVRGAVRMDDGTIVVMESGTNQIRLFDSGGRFVRNLGRTGEGPGEFTFLTEMWVSGDTIFGFCNLQKRIAVFDRGGDVLEMVRVEMAEGAGNPAAEDHFPDGTLLVLSAPSGGLAFTLGTIKGNAWRLDRFSRDGRFMNEIAFVKEADRWGHDIPGVWSFPYLPLTLGIGPHAAGRHHVYVGDHTQGRIERRNGSGDLTRVIRWPTPELRVTDRERRRYREARSEPPRDVDRAGWNRYLRETPFPDRMPAYRRLLVDGLGNPWAERYRPPWESEQSSWYVFDDQGVWLGEVPVPDGLWVFEVGADYVLGLRRDELDVPFVVTFPLHRGG